MNPRADELTLFEGSWAAVAKKREPRDQSRKGPIKTHTHQVAESDRVVKSCNVPQYSQASKAFQKANLNFKGAQNGSPEARRIANGLVPMSMKSSVPVADKALMQSHDKAKEHSHKTNGSLSPHSFQGKR